MNGKGEKTSLTNHESYIFCSSSLDARCLSKSHAPTSRGEIGGPATTENWPPQPAKVTFVSSTALPMRGLGRRTESSAPKPVRQLSENPQDKTLPRGLTARELSMPAATIEASIPCGECQHGLSAVIDHSFLASLLPAMTVGVDTIRGLERLSNKMSSVGRPATSMPSWPSSQRPQARTCPSWVQARL